MYLSNVLYNLLSNPSIILHSKYQLMAFVKYNLDLEFSNINLALLTIVSGHTQVSDSSTQIESTQFKTD